MLFAGGHMIVVVGHMMLTVGLMMFFVCHMMIAVGHMIVVVSLIFLLLFLIFFCLPLLLPLLLLLPFLLLLLPLLFLQDKDPCVLPPISLHLFPLRGEQEEVEYDMCFHLLQLYCCRNHSLESILAPSGSTPYQLDYRIRYIHSTAHYITGSVLLCNVLS